jgi:hypothetical protein
MRFCDELIGHPIYNKTIYYAGSDREPTYKENLAKMPADWYYRNHEVIYKYNKHGHRCIELADLNFENYILFLGDSQTEGIGLELETTYPYLVSQKLGIPYYNLGLGGSGPDSMCYNLSLWLSKFPKPKFISLYWSDHTRFVTKIKGSNLYTVGGLWSDDIIRKEFVKYAELSGFFEARLFLNANMINNLLNYHKIAHTSISFFNDEVPNTAVKLFKPVDRARDLMHGGIETNRIVADYIVSEYTDKYQYARDNYNT